MNPSHITVQEATDEASHDHITAHELDILVSKTREMNRKRDRDLERIRTILLKIEERVLP